MDSAKGIRVAPIGQQDAHRFVRANHYSGKSVQNSQLHLGAFNGQRLIGVAQFGPPMDRSKVIGLVRDTPWTGMLELNRLAMVNDTPKNTESRFLSVCMKLIARHYPHVQWVLSFADGTQCGDGTIYRASGFVLTGIKRNTQIWEAPDGATIASRVLQAGGNGGSVIKAKYGIPWGVDGRRAVFPRTALTDGRSKQQQQQRALTISRTTATKAGNILDTGAASMKMFAEAGFRPLPGFQLRYIYFIDRTARARLTVPVLPFSEIAARGAGMYLGRPRAGSIVVDAASDQDAEGGAEPTSALHASPRLVS